MARPAATLRGLEGSAGRILEEYLEQVDAGRQARERLLCALAAELLPRVAGLAGGVEAASAPLRSFLRRYSTPEKMRQAAPSDLRRLLDEAGDRGRESGGSGSAAAAAASRGGETRRWLLARCLAEDLLRLRARARTLELLGRRSAAAEGRRAAASVCGVDGGAVKGDGS